MAKKTEPEIEHIFVKGEGGGTFKMDLPLPEAIEDKLLRGHITRVADLEGNPYVAPVPEATPPTAPKKNAPKPEWIGWAVEESARRGTPITADDAEALTVQDLIDHYGPKDN